ncbi:hypothetical protein BD626DRAFT_636520 [Schizophyllum amplum]|uniref:MYND-type domain-containing protein n=1 Tax=Schizophyllum amplum TaxID=97359 RepID=A0A550BT82_9AGAR|nr:hypothetical protein BD626DRAFT_636520 [Auriculariopsis ampla]
MREPQLKYHARIPRDANLQRMLQAIQNVFAIEENGSTLTLHTRAKADIAIILAILRRHDPLRILRYEPPSPDVLSYTGFWRDPAYADVVDGIMCVTGLRSLSDRPNLANLWTDDSIWTHVFKWLEYMSTPNRESAPAAVDLADRDFFLHHFACPSIDAIVFSLIDLATDSFEPILLLPEVGAAGFFIRLWLYWPGLCLTADGAEHENSGKLLISILEAIQTCLAPYMVEATREIVMRNMLSTVANRPDRIFRIIAGHIDHLLALTPRSASEQEIWSLHVQLVSMLADLPALRPKGGYPRRIVRSLLAALHAGLVPLRGAYIAESARNLLQKFLESSTDAHLVTTAIRHGIFPDLCIMSTAPGGEAVVRPTLVLVAGALTTPTALRGFHNTLSMRRMPQLQYTRQDNDTILSCDQRLALIDKWKTEWSALQTCGRRECPNPDRTDMRACICGEVLYCSIECQREHWGDTGHQLTCNRNPEVHGALSAKAFSFLVAIARVNLEGVYKDIISRFGDTVPEEHNWSAGHIRPRYWHLSQSWFKTDTALPVEEGLTPRERIFGKLEGLSQ